MSMFYVFAVIWISTLIIAAVSDLRAYRIPNILPGILILLFGVMQFVDSSAEIPWENLAHFGATLIVGMFLFSRGWIGGGDAKLYAATALWFAANGAAALLFFTTIAGALLALSFIVARLTGLRKNIPKEDRRIPYGVAIAAGGVITAAFLGWSAVFANLT
ncbi:prepilin peptidase [Sphingorhabdus sp.]|uniref:A24 family peptidase n=1 Tax=Sphingorhabdus sp. TaxID=1902408 RepID=UPI0039198470